MLITLTRELAFAASLDAANRTMRAAGRKTWNREDADVAAAEFNRLWPLCPHGADRECCCLCLAQPEPPHRTKPRNRKGPVSTGP